MKTFRFFVLSLSAMLMVNLPMAISANTSFSEGYQLMQQSLFEQAAVKFQGALSQEPNHASSMSSLAMCLEKLKRYDEAIRIWRRYDQVKPSGKIIHEHIALIGQMKNITPALQSANLGPVMAILKQILRDPYKNSIIALDAATALARAYYSQNKFPEAYSLYSQLITRYSTYLIDDVGIYEHAKLLSSQERKYLEAVRYCKELLARPNLSLSRDEIIDLIAESYKSEAERIEKSSDKDKDKKARLLYEKIVLECPTSKYADMAKSKVGDITKLGKGLKTKADMFFDKGDYGQALSVYKQIIFNETNPNIIEYAMFQVGICLNAQNRNTEAVKAFHQVVIKYPHGAWADKALAEAACRLEMMNKPELALKEWKLLLTRYPDSEYVDNAYYFMGNIYKKLRQNKKSYALFRKLIKEYPNSPWIFLAKQRIAEMKHAR